VVKGPAGDCDVNAEDLAASVVSLMHLIEIVACDLAFAIDFQAEDQFAVERADKRDIGRT
jgi:hypothetical protein